MATWWPCTLLNHTTITVWCCKLHTYTAQVNKGGKLKVSLRWEDKASANTVCPEQRIPDCHMTVWVLSGVLPVARLSYLTLRRCGKTIQATVIPEAYLSG